MGCISFVGFLFVTFLGKQKSKEKNLLLMREEIQKKEHKKSRYKSSFMPHP
jgi:hypothetical protein